MRRYRPAPLLVACLGLILTAAARAEAPPDPLRLVPDQADVVIKVEKPRQLAESVTANDLLKQLQTLDPVKELLDSTIYRRFYQLVTYFEKELGAKWPELLDRLAGGGVVLAAKAGPNPAPSLLVIQGRDPELVQKFAKLALEVIEQELARQEAKDRPEKDTYRGVETVRVGKDFHAAVVGSTLLISNKDDVLHLALDLQADGGEKSLAHVGSVAEARKLLPADPWAWAWVNLETVHKAPQAKDAFKLPRENAALTVLFGGYLDVAGRSPFACAGLYPEKDGFVTTVRLPRGRDGLPPPLAAHVPPAGEPGSRPLLKPKGVMFSSSYYVDAAKFWEERQKLFGDAQAKAFEDFDKNSGAFLAGTPFSKLLTQAGTYQRVVVAHQAKPGYQITPKVAIPAFAFVVEAREPEEFARSMETVLRGAALLAGNQARLKLTEEKHGDITIIGYRFDEKFQLKQDVNDIRFNFSPCFFAVGKQYVVSSTLELGHELADLLEKEGKDAAAKGQPATALSEVYASGGAEFLRGIEDVLLTQAILDQALTPAEAKQQVRTALDLLAKLGTVRLESVWGEKEFRYDIRLIRDK
jgi:Protein of unknown function (DUF3352)